MKRNPKPKTQNLKPNGGQLLIESIIGVSIALVGLLGIITLVSHSTSLNRVNANQFVGNYLAAEGLEIVRNLIDANIIQGKAWNYGFNVAGDFEANYTSTSTVPSQNRPLLFDSTTKFYSYQSGGPTPFKRTIRIQPIGSDEIKVNSIVTWTTRGGGQFEVNIEDHFLNWRATSTLP